MTTDRILENLRATEGHAAGTHALDAARAQCQRLGVHLSQTALGEIVSAAVEAAWSYAGPSITGILRERLLAEGHATRFIRAYDGHGRPVWQHDVCNAVTGISEADLVADQWRCTTCLMAGEDQWVALYVRRAPVRVLDEMGDPK